MDSEMFKYEVGRIDKTTFAKIELNCFPQWGDMMNNQNALYYYTNINALINGILDKKDNVCLWATRWSHLNDPEELLMTFNDLNLSVKTKWSNNDFLELLKYNHSVSFSFFCDYLPMWKMYGDGGNGVMLVFDTKKLLLAFGSFLQPCIYKGTAEYSHAQRKIFNLDCIQEFNALTTAQQIYTKIKMLQIFISITKSDDYQYEKEARLIGLGNPNMTGECEQKYRLSGNNIIPYVETLIPKEALKGVCLGPLVKTELNKKVLEEFLISKGYNDVEVSMSKIQYR